MLGKHRAWHGTSCIAKRETHARLVYNSVSGESELKEAFYPRFYPHIFMLKFLHVEPADPWVRAEPTDEHTLYEKAEEQTCFLFTCTKRLIYSNE